jgi:glycosyltransferase involved in cell wall biosynthesis
MQAATVLAHPARWEGFGLVLLEAMANGLPIVATAVSAIPEVVDDGRVGLLVPPEDPAALARAMDRFLADATLRSAHAERGRRRVADVFSPARMAAAHLDVYESALAARAGAR